MLRIVHFSLERLRLHLSLLPAPLLVFHLRDFFLSVQEENEWRKRSEHFKKILMTFVVSVQVQSVLDG